MQLRRVVRAALGALVPETAAAPPLLLAALSGGQDSLALAAACASEAATLGMRAGAVIVDHGLQDDSAAVAEAAAATATGLGLAPVVVRRVDVPGGGNVEANARDARYRAFADVAAETGAAAVCTGHTSDDQAEQVLLALARGSGTRSIAGMPVTRPLGRDTLLVRPLLFGEAQVTRQATGRACAELGLTPWADPHNLDPSFARVRVRERALPALAAELGPGVRAGLARSAQLAREDAAALDSWARDVTADLLAQAAGGTDEAAIDSRSAGDAHRGAGTLGARALVLDGRALESLAALPAAIRQRVLQQIAQEGFGAALGRAHVLALARLVTDWRGRGPAFVPGIRVTRSRAALRFERPSGSPREVTASFSES